MEEFLCASAPDWQLLPENLLLRIFSYLPSQIVFRSSQVCSTWYRVAHDELLWKHLFYSHWHIDRAVPMARGKVSWMQEYKRLYYHTPTVESEVIKQHSDQVLHISFSHNGKMFATTSKDGFIKLWNSTSPVTLRYKNDMKKFTWKYTQFSQFNESDTLLMVCGVHFGAQSTSGEIAVFSIQDGFELQSRVLNKPYDVFGTWYNDTHLLSGSLTWTGQLKSSSSLWLNKAFQATDSEHESVVMRLFRFHNVNASSIRTVMIANCPEESERDGDEKTAQPSAGPAGSQAEIQKQINRTSEKRTCSEGQQVRRSCKRLQGMRIYESQVKLPEVDDAESEDRRNGMFEYNSEYRQAENSQWDARLEEQAHNSSSSFRHDFCENLFSSTGWMIHNGLAECNKECLFHEEDICQDDSELDPSVNLRRVPEEVVSEQDNHVLNCSWLSSAVPDPCSPVLVPTTVNGSTFTGRCELENANAKCIPPMAHNLPTEKVSQKFRDKYLIFTTGSKTYTPHQVGIKKLKSLEAARGVDMLDSGNQPLLPNVKESLYSIESDNFDRVDHLIDLHGHIIGMCLSPDHRYLYVNCRPWPKCYHIENPEYPPPIAQEIDIHVIDLLWMREVGTMHRSHRAYTPNDECFFIFLDVCDEYVASGAEDKFGYLWDRHYGLCLNKFPHKDVVNSVAFNPKNPEMLVTVSDDNSIKVWRSRNLVKMLAMRRKQ